MRGLIAAGLHPIQSSSYPTLASSQASPVQDARDHVTARQVLRILAGLSSRMHCRFIVACLAGEECQDLEEGLGRDYLRWSSRDAFRNDWETVGAYIY
jgi:hypothetical protein